LETSGQVHHIVFSSTKQSFLQIKAIKAVYSDVCQRKPISDRGHAHAKRMMFPSLSLILIYSGVAVDFYNAFS